MMRVDLDQLRSSIEQPVLLLGASGMLGRAFAAQLARAGVEHTRATRNELDLARPVDIGPFLCERRPATLINCAAWTDVDGAESREIDANRVNVEAVAALASYCAGGALLVQFSTDYVFNGSASSPYPVDARRDPVNAYGRGKARGEEAIESACCRFLNIRTSWLYAPWGKNFVRTIAAHALKKPVLRVVNDQRGRPTSSEHLALATLALLAAGQTGHQHITDGGECTWYEFAAEIARTVNPECRVEPCTSDEFPRPARRPAYSVLDLFRTERIIGPMPPWGTNLASVLARLEP